MDTSLSAKKDKDKGKSKKNKEKKGKREKKQKKKQNVSIDLTSPVASAATALPSRTPARDQTPSPVSAHTGRVPDCTTSPAYNTPRIQALVPARDQAVHTSAPSQKAGKRRGRSTTGREEAPPPASKNDHTCNSRPLPLFSSNDSTGPPSTGQRNVRLCAKSAAATPDRRTNEIERSSYNHDCKIQTFETCLSLKDHYLAMPPAVQTDQEPFWTRARDLTERRFVTRGKFKDWQAVQRAVESWCQPRRSSMREDRLPAVSQSHPELDELVDQWNLVFAQRFCKIHIGYFSNAIWPQFAEEKLTEMVESNLNARIADILTKRCEALQGPNPTALLPTNSSLEDYGNALKAMNSSRSAAARTNENLVRKSEAVMSMVLELQPGLRAALSQFLSGHTAASRERVNSTIPLSQTAPSALQRPPSSLGPTPLRPHPSFPLPAQPPPPEIPTRPQEGQDSSRSSHYIKPPEKSGEESSRKRKDLDLPTRSRASMKPRGSGAHFNEDGNKPEASSHDQAKRPRYESHSSDLPPASNFELGGRDNHDARTPSYQRPKTSYGPTETQGHKIPPMTPCPTGTGPTTGPRTDVPPRPADSYQTPGNSQPTTRNHGQHRGDSQVPGNYYRPDSMSRRRSNW